MSMQRKWVMVVAGAVLSTGLVGATAAVASAKGRATPVSATGPTTCNFNGSLQVTDTSNLGLVANMTPFKGTPACNNTGGTSMLRTGHLRNAVSSNTWSDLCGLLTGTQPSDLSNALMFWAPRSRVADSTGVSLTGGNVTQTPPDANGNSFLQLSYSGTVTAGSFTGSFSMTATSTADVASLQSECAAGPVTGIHFRGSINLA